MFGVSFECATIFLDGSDRANVVIIATEHDFIESDSSCLYECESEHLSCVSFSPFTRSYPIPDVSTIISEIRMVYGMTYLDASEDSLSIHEEKKSCRNSSIPLVGEVTFCYLEKFLIRIPTKECPRGNVSLLEFFRCFPFSNHIKIWCLMRNIGEFKFEHAGVH